MFYLKHDGIKCFFSLCLLYGTQREKKNTPHLGVVYLHGSYATVVVSVLPVFSVDDTHVFMQICIFPDTVRCKRSVSGSHPNEETKNCK